MAHVVIGGHDVAGIHQRDDHVEIATRMLAKAMDELDDAFGLGGGDIDPAGYLVATIGRGELDFVKHGASLLSEDGFCSGARFRCAHAHYRIWRRGKKARVYGMP